MKIGSEKKDLQRRRPVSAPAGTAAAARLGMFAAVAVLCTSVAPGYAQGPSEQERKAEIGFFEIDKDITLRRMVVHNPRPKGTVLFLHGFPETLYAWKDISLALADDYETHAFDWPGYGLSSRPTVDRFSYAPKDYAHVLNEYVGKAGIDTSKLTIYATDIGALPALLLALEKPDIARTIIVGDFAPFNRPRYMYESLQNLKAGPLADQARAQLNKNREDILRKCFQKRFAPGSPIRGFPGVEGRHVPRLGPRRDDDGGRFCQLLLAFYAGPRPLRIATGPAQNPGEGGLG
jgi:pimeloyl-ACP methyl ester carboxylesterase